eukprot:XP_001702683.1 predicted protein [Chlamydomonas reinhardtii]
MSGGAGDGGGPTARHVAYVGHPEADGYAKHLLTLLAQRRELQTDDVRRVLTDASVYAAAASPSTPAQSDPAASGGALDGGAPAPLLPASIFSGTVTAASIDKERRELQSELSMGLEWRPQPSVAEACRAAVEGAGKPMAGPQLALGSSSSAESMPMTLATDNSARHHKAAYDARRMLPKLMARHRRRWPGASLSGEAAAAALLADDSELDPYADDPTCSVRDQVRLVRVLEEELGALTPSLEGDESAGWAAVLRTLPLQVDEALKAENAFLEEADERAAYDRLRSLAEAHARASHGLQDKTMEALYIARYLVSRRNKLRPQLLGARRQLRREMIDLCFRRPALALEDGYFAERYLADTLGLELEATLAGQLTNLLRHHVELADLRRAVLQYGVTEMGLLLREEAHRAQAVVERQPKDSMYDGARGKRDLHPDAPLLRGNWLCASHVADNAEVLRATALEEGTPPRAALEVFLNKEALIRHLYRGELLWLVGVVQARALGRRVAHPELFGIDWGQIDAQGNALKAELLSEVVQMCEPSEMDPPGVAGPGGNPEVAAGAVAPKLLNAHSLGGLRAMLRRGDAAHACLPAAVLLDGIIRKLDRRRRVLMWRMAAMEGVADDKAMDVVARRTYVQGLVRAKGGGGGGGPLGPEVEAAVRADTESAYAAAFLGELLPAAARTQLAAAVRELAVLVLGGTGGYGADWGIRYDADGQLLTPREDRGPLFQGPEGQAALRAAVLEYAPLWQKGVAVAGLVNEVVRHFIFTAGLLAPSALLAAGGDVSGQTSGLAPLTRTGVPPAAAVSYNPAGPTRTQLYQQSEVRMLAAGCSFLPGALLAADLVKLQARLQYLHRPAVGAGAKPPPGAASPAPQPTQPADEVIGALRRELAVAATCRILAVARARDNLLAAGPGKKQSWYLAGALPGGVPGAGGHGAARRDGAVRVLCGGDVGARQARQLEGCVAVCKQQLDLQAVQVALLRLHQDCTQLAGLRAVAAAASASVSGEAGGGLLHPHALPAAALGGLARKLMARQRRGGPTGNDAVVELSMDELTRWLSEAATTLTASARAGGNPARTPFHHSFDPVIGLVLILGVKVRYPTPKRDATASSGAGPMDAGGHRTNSSIMRSELQKAALEALIEVRRETLNRAFNNGSMKMTDERLHVCVSILGRGIPQAKRQLEESQTEILDLQRAISKVQAWFKMRSAAFLTACLTEVAAARGRAEGLEAELWEARERSELALEQLGTQLKATQADLEAVSAGAARNASDLRHALASNKKLLKWKVTTAPRIEALKMRMADMTKHREAWLEWVNSKQGLMAHLGTQISHLKSLLANERLVKNDVFERLLKLEQQYMALAQSPAGQAAMMMVAPSGGAAGAAGMQQQPQQQQGAAGVDMDGSGVGLGVGAAPSPARRGVGASVVTAAASGGRSPVVRTSGAGGSVYSHSLGAGVGVGLPDAGVQGEGILETGSMPTSPTGSLGITGSPRGDASQYQHQQQQRRPVMLVGPAPGPAGLEAPPSAAAMSSCLPALDNRSYAVLQQARKCSFQVWQGLALFTSSSQPPPAAAPPHNASSAACHVPAPPIHGYPPASSRTSAPAALLCNLAASPLYRRRIAVLLRDASTMRLSNID